MGGDGEEGKLTNRFGMMNYIRVLSKTGKRIKAVKSQTFAGQMPKRYIRTRCRRKDSQAPPKEGAGCSLSLGLWGRAAGSTQSLGRDGNPLPAVLGVYFVGFNWDKKKEK